MRNLFLISIIILFSSSLFSQENIAVFNIDTLASHIQWTGEKLTREHTGKIYLDSSYIELTNGNITAGKFIIDMNTMTNEDISDTTEKQTIIRHLKSKDFFDVEFYPYAKLKIIRAIPNPLAKKNQPNYTIISDLSIKDSTHTIVFPAIITMNDKELIANAKFNIDRTKFGIVYNSYKYFPNLTDVLINDKIKFKIYLRCVRLNNNEQEK